VGQNGPKWANIASEAQNHSEFIKGTREEKDKKQHTVILPD